MLFKRKSPQEKELHIIANSHLVDPSELTGVMDQTGLDKKALYFDELKEQRWKDPSSLPFFTGYINHLISYLADAKASIVPMGHDHLMHPHFNWPFDNACQAAEDVYMVEHVVVPALNRNKHSKAVIHVGAGHLERFVEELGKHDYDPKVHRLCEYAPGIDQIRAIQDFVLGKRDTILSGDFVIDFFERVLDLMGNTGITTEEAMQLLPSNDEAFVKEFRRVSPQIFGDEAFYEQYTIVPEPDLAVRLKQAYETGRAACDKMREYAVHPTIPAKTLMQKT